MRNKQSSKPCWQRNNLFILIALIALIWASSLILFQINQQHHDDAIERSLQVTEEVKSLLKETKILLKQPKQNVPSPITVVQNCTSEKESFPEAERPDNDIIILLWEGENWAGFGKPGEVLKVPNYLGHEVERKCNIPCKYVTDRSKVSVADAVIFEASTYGLDAFTSTPITGRIKFPMKRDWQKWINFGYETHLYFPIQTHYTWENMDMNMTYDQNDKDGVPITLTCSWGGGKESIDDFLIEPKPIESREKSPVVFMATNCGAGGAEMRTNYVKEMMKYINIDSYGGCLHNKDLPNDYKGKIYSDHGKSMRDKIKLFSNYKFSLSFENNNVIDYVTEKLPCVLQAGSVPVYMGAPNIDDWLPGDHSIIKTSDFNGPKELAEYLNYLDKNPDEYNKYFKWKENGVSEKFKEKYSRCVFYGAECRLCEKISEIRKSIPRKYPEIMYGLSFDGSGSVIVENNKKINEMNDEFTITTWINSNSFNDYRIIDKNTPGSINGFNFDIIKSGNHGKLRLCAGNRCVESDKGIYRNIWYHVTVSYSIYSNSIKFYINGKLDKSIDLGDKDKLIPISSNSLPLRIGSTDSTGYWDGMIDDVIIFTKEIDISIVRYTMYNLLDLSNPSIHNHLLAYYTFNEGSGKVVYDKSGNELHGKLSGGVGYFLSETKPVYLRSFDVQINLN